MNSIAQNIARVSINQEVATREREFVTLARVLLAAQGGRNNETAIDVARRVGAGRRVEAIVKDAAAAGSIAGWGDDVSAEYNRLSAAFVQSLRNYGAFDRMLADGFVVVPPRTRIGLTTTGATGSTVAEASLKPISSLALSDLGILQPQKSSCIVVVTEEVVDSPGAADLLGNELKAGVAVATDAGFIAIATTAGLASTGTAGTSLANIVTDLSYLFANVTTSARSKLFLVTTSLLCKKMALKSDATGARAFPDLGFAGGSIAGVPVLVSDAVASGVVLLVDASGFAASSEVVVLDASRSATLQMESAPDSPPVAGTVTTSLWQRNLRALRAERWWACQRLRDSAVARITGASY
jgi:hypothetical protein